MCQTRLGLQGYSAAWFSAVAAQQLCHSAAGYPLFLGVYFPTCVQCCTRQKLIAAEPERHQQPQVSAGRGAVEVWLEPLCCGP